MECVIVNKQSKFLIKEKTLQQLTISVSKKIKLSLPELSIVFVSPGRMRVINRQFLKHDYVTDVITFLHGEIIICPEIAYRQARTYGQRYEDEICLYVIHGLLHLKGYDDHHQDDMKKMRQAEQRLMKAFVL